MATDQTETRSGAIVAPKRQLVLGIVLLVIGVAAAIGLFAAGTTVAVGVGILIAVWGLVLIGNFLFLKGRRR